MYDTWYHTEKLIITIFNLSSILFSIYDIAISPPFILFSYLKKKTLEKAIEAHNIKQNLCKTVKYIYFKKSKL